MTRNRSLCLAITSLALLGLARCDKPKTETSTTVTLPVVEETAPAQPATSVDGTHDAAPSASVAAEVTPPPTTLKGWIELGREQMDRDDPHSALASSAQALTLDGSSVAAQHLKGRALLALNRADEAIATLTAAHEAAPQNGYVANTLGYALLLHGEAEEAIPFLEVARDRIPQIDYVHNNLGVAYERVGRREDAIAEYRLAVNAGDKSGKASASLARLLPSTPTPSEVEQVSVETETEPNGSQQ